MTPLAADIIRTLAIGVLTAIVVRWLVGRYRAWRRRSQNGRAWQAYKGRLAGWVKTVEALTALVVYLALMALWFGVLALWPHGNPDSTRVGLFLLAGLFAGLVPALLLTNMISYSIPAMRRANNAAFEGFETPSFASANLGLVKVAAFTTLPALLAAAGVMFWPG